MVGSSGGRTDGSTTDCWSNGWCYCGRAKTWVVERAVLPWNHGRTSGSTIFWGRDVSLVRDVLPWNHGRMRCSTNCWGSIVFNLAVLPWNYGRTGGSTNFWGRNGF